MAEPGGSSSRATPRAIQLVIKNPSKPGARDFTIEVPADATVFDVKQKLQAEYDGNPKPEQQTVIYAGKVLKEDGVALRRILRQSDPEATSTLHLVVKGAVEPTRLPPAAASSSNHAASSSGQPHAESAELPSIPGADPPRGSSSPPGPAAGVHSIPAQHPLQPQVSYQLGGWPVPGPDPTILAAYNAALESLRTRPPFPTLPHGQGPSTSAASSHPLPQLPGLYGQAGFSISPALLQPPRNLVGPQAPPAGQNGAARSVGPGPQLGASQQQGNGQRVPQLYAPALAYVPVSLVQSSVQQQPQAGPSQEAAAAAAAQAAQAAQQQPPPGGQPPPGLFPYPHFAPMVPMMMPFGFNPYQPPMLAGNQFPAPPQPPGQPEHGRVPPPPRAPAHHPRAAAGVAGVGAAQGRPAQQIRVRLIRINVKLLMQLGILALILYQNTSHSHFLKLVGTAAALFFLWPIVNRDNPLRRRLQRYLQPQQPPGAAAAGDGGGPRNPGGPRQPRQQAGGLLQELQALLLGFFTSLLPGLNMNAEDAAAFAQAQQIVAEEAAAERQQQQGAAREHVD